MTSHQAANANGTLFMKKSCWIEGVEWLVCGLVILLLSGVFAMRGEITSGAQGNPAVPVESIGD